MIRCTYAEANDYDCDVGNCLNDMDGDGMRRIRNRWLSGRMWLHSRSVTMMRTRNTDSVPRMYRRGCV